jgi:hypothetical protein
LSDTSSPSDGSRASGLWLWQGKPPLPTSPPQPASRVQQSVDHPVVSALRKRGWIALPGGVALALLAVMLRSTPADKPEPTDTPAVVLEPVPSPAEAHAVIPAPPVNIPAPRVEHADTQLDQTQIPTAPPALSPARETEHQPAKKAAHHTSSARTVRTHAFAGGSSPFVIHGVLTPPDHPTVRHDGGH